MHLSTGRCQKVASTIGVDQLDVNKLKVAVAEFTITGRNAEVETNPLIPYACGEKCECYPRMVNFVYLDWVGKKMKEVVWAIATAQDLSCSECNC